MAISDYPAAAIDTLLREHAPTIMGEAEAGTRFQSLKRQLNALESQRLILKRAKELTRRGNFDPWTQTFDLLDWAHALEGAVGIYGNNIGVGYERLNLLDWRADRVGTVAAGGDSLRGVPLPQAPEILGWCQETIERIARTLTQDQIDQILTAGDPDFAHPWSPFTMGRIILRDRLQQRILSSEKQSAALKQQWNRQLPIARLPLELLLQVFGSVLSAEPPERRDETFILCTVLMRICRDWTRIIQSTPGLWNRISHYSSSSRQVMMALNKSKPLPLSVRVNGARIPHTALGHFLRLITENVDRLTVLELHLTWRSLVVLNGWLAKVFPPHLRRLRVSLQPTGSIWRSSSRIKPFGGRWPNSLKHFGIVGCGIDSSRYAELRGLATLEISKLPSGQEVGVAEILHLLSNCPEIESLTLNGRIVVDKQPTLPNPVLPVRLDQLRQISLSLEPAPMNALLRSIQIGSCTELRIEAIQPPRSQSAWTESLLTHEIRPFVRVLNSVLSSASAVSIKVDSESIKLSTDSPESDSVVCLTFRGVGLAEVGRWMANSLTLGLASVTLYFAAIGSTWMETLPLILSNFNHVVKLTFVGLGTAYQQAIDFLGTPIHTEATGHQHFPAPRLAYMDVMGQYIPNIIDMIQRRQSAELGGVERPAKLSRLVLRKNLYGESLDHETIGRLFSDLAGGEVELLIV